MSARAGFLGILILAAMGVAALLYLASLPACACGALPAREMQVAPVEDGYEVRSFTAGTRYADVAVMVDNARLTMTQGAPPAYGEWAALREGAPLAPADALAARDVLVVAGPGETVLLLDLAANSIMQRVALAR